ncbi:hypothetical protein HYV57_05675 [Candidatus Peregrinibacteria bacterium]|nr:hypothetical protein [Candidatus Peregrinibacteria bacterium]
MSVLPLLILFTTAIFVAGIAAQSFLRLRFCAVCVAVSGTWLLLLSFRFFGYNVNSTLIGVLMGESVVGLYYLLEKKAPVKWQLFRWPFIITMTVIVYLSIGIRDGVIMAMTFLAFLWLVFTGIYLFQNHPNMQKIMERLIACCRDW